MFPLRDNAVEGEFAPKEGRSLRYLHAHVKTTATKETDWTALRRARRPNQLRACAWRRAPVLPTLRAHSAVQWRIRRGDSVNLTLVVTERDVLELHVGGKDLAQILAMALAQVVALIHVDCNSRR